MGSNLRELVGSIRANQIELAKADYTRQLRVVQSGEFDDDEDLFDASGMIANHFISQIESGYSNYIQEIKQGNDETLHDLEAKWFFDLYFSFESDITVCFMSDFITAQHTMAYIYRTRVAMIDYLLKCKGLYCAVKRLTSFDAEQVESFKSVKLFLDTITTSTGFAAPLFTTVAESLVELKTLITDIIHIRIAEGVDVKDCEGDV